MMDSHSTQVSPSACPAHLNEIEQLRTSQHAASSGAHVVQLKEVLKTGVFLVQILDAEG